MINEIGHSRTHRGSRVDSGSCVLTRARIRFAGFIWVCVCVLRCAYRSPGSFGFHSGAPRVRRVHLRSRAIIRANQRVSGFVRVR